MSIKTVYVIHHSHTDLGYTDLQERVLVNQADYIRSVLKLMDRPENQDFRWNCETLFCVEEFFKSATEEEKAKFLELVRTGKMGISANYLNFTDLADSEVCADRLKAWQALFAEQGIALHTAMMADINGISMGYRDALMACGTEFLYTNIHCHHGMYPLRQNQTAFYWENQAGQRLLVWNGEHYNLGNVLGIMPHYSTGFMNTTYLGEEKICPDPVDTLRSNLKTYLGSCEDQGYSYDFIPMSVSGVFSDNAPPETLILRTIESFNARYGDEVRIRMVSLQEFYAAIRDKLTDVPVYRGDMTDWWANGIGSTPYPVKHFREAQHRYHLCKRLDPEAEAHYPDLARAAQDNLLLYAEHTWGHSCTVTNPYETMVLNLDMRKNSYASKAHEAASLMMTHIAAKKGDTLRYYNTTGAIRVLNPGDQAGPIPVEFYIECGQMGDMEIHTPDGKVLPAQVSSHPRGRRITFVDTFGPREEKCYTYHEIPAKVQALNTRKCYCGSERVRDIVNDYDPDTYKLPYGFENAFFKLTYRPHVGVTAFVDKRIGRDLLGVGGAPFFTPIHQVTPITPAHQRDGNPPELERRLLGRNIRGPHAVTTLGHLEEVIVEDRGVAFTQLRLRFTLPGTIHADTVVKFYNDVPRVEFWLELGKTLSTDIESIFLPLSLNLAGSQVYLRKGREAFRPGVDQLPGTCMEFYMTDDGLAYVSDQGSAVIATPDTPLVYFGELAHHPIRLCEGNPADNARPAYSWIMNNNWETNFKMDLAGFAQFHYCLWLTDDKTGEEAMNSLRERTFEPYVLITE